MTMIPAAQNLSKQHCYGGGYGGAGGCSDSFPDGFGLMSRLEGYGCSEACLGSDLVVGPMAEDESRTESVNEAGSSSKDAQEERDDEWLQLSIGGQTHSAAHHDNSKQDHRLVDQSSRRGGGGPLELDLLPASSSSEQLRSLAPIFHVPELHAPRALSSITSAAAAYSASLFLQHPATTISSFPHQEINWAFRPFPRSMVAASPSSSSSLGPPGSYFARPFQLHTGLGVARPGLDFRVVDPPRRPHSGIWFMLQAAQNQAKEPFLPQIPKSFLRTRDGRMTIRLVIKYLVNKLKLESESEVEIRCRGQQIVPFLTLQHVRDSVWSPRDALVTLLPADCSPSSSSSSPTTAADHIMVLHYGRSP